MNLVLLTAALASLIGLGVSADTEPLIDLKPATVAAYEQYLRGVEAEANRRASGAKNFLWLDDSPARRSRVLGGEVVTERTTGTKPTKVPDGLVHDWIGTVFIPHVKLAQVLTFVQDYNHHKDFYGPEVMDARIISREGEHFVLFMRLRKHKVITVVLNTWHDAQFFPLDQTRWHSRSRTTRITELENPGTPREREKPAGGGGGYMWGLNSYWRFFERDGGVYVECEAVSLSRGIPMGWLLGPIIGPIVNDLPRESLANTLTATRSGVRAQQTQGQRLLEEGVLPRGIVEPE
jgi:hypothetical protein